MSRNCDHVKISTLSWSNFWFRQHSQFFYHWPLPKIRGVSGHGLMFWLLTKEEISGCPWLWPNSWPMTMGISQGIHGHGRKSKVSMSMVKFRDHWPWGKFQDILVSALTPPTEFTTTNNVILSLSMCLKLCPCVCNFVHVYVTMNFDVIFSTGRTSRQIWRQIIP